MTSRNLESFGAEMCFKWLLGTIIWAAGKPWPSYPSPKKSLDIRRLSFPTLASVRLTLRVTLFELVVSCHWQLFICSARSIACFWRNAPNIWKKHATLWTFHKSLSAIKTDAMQLSSSYFFQSWNGRNHSTWFRIFCEPCNHGCQVLFTTWSYSCTLTLFNHSSYLLHPFAVFEDLFSRLKGKLLPMASAAVTSSHFSCFLALQSGCWMTSPLQRNRKCIRKLFQ